MPPPQFGGRIQPTTPPPQPQKTPTLPAGKNLQAQYERWQPRAKYKMHLDPTVEDVKKLVTSCRRTAKVCHPSVPALSVSPECANPLTPPLPQGGVLCIVGLVSLLHAHSHSRWRCCAACSLSTAIRMCVPKRGHGCC